MIRNGTETLKKEQAHAVTSIVFWNVQITSEITSAMVPPHCLPVAVGVQIVQSDFVFHWKLLSSGSR